MNAAVARRALERLFAWKIRGIRWVEIIGVLMVGAMIFSVYLAKAAAARESARIAELERRISEDGRRVRLLRAQVAHLEQPARLEALSRDVGLGPVDMKRQASEERLDQLQPLPSPAPAPAAPAAPSAPEAAPVEPETAEPTGEGAR
ncbi:cell division protein [Brevundimonas sp. M20]|uniref:cell division protein FtsL n=1 Tax=Brevundimonas sp. M20 TaxID=2591463 RepID=UPI00114719F3|nr:cell division protein [Brevundimonas sp. M20]QDH74131.1 cell division protein [Brevundimonas sp. M20]